MKMTNHSHDRLLKRWLPVVVLAVIGLTGAQAHPGHALGEAHAAHLLMSADHLAAFALAGGALGAAAFFVPRGWLRQGLRVTGALAVVAAIVLFNLRG